MTQFSKCMDIVNRLDQEDQDSVLSKLDKYVDMGVSAKKAQRMAAVDAMEELKQERVDFERLVEEQHPAQEEDTKTGGDQNPVLSAKRNLPNVMIASKLGSLEADDGYHDAKTGDTAAARKLVDGVLTPEFMDQLKDIEDPIVTGVFSLEKEGSNAIPGAAAYVIAKHIGGDLDTEITPASAPKRTTMDGLGRIFARPQFDGQVEAGRNYILVDDTITQGGTFAAMAAHVQDGGGKIAALIALSGKTYSAILRADENLIGTLRNKIGDAEHAFQRATGHDFEQLTASEARYLASYKPVDQLRNRIEAAADEADVRGLRGDGSDVSSDITQSAKRTDIITSTGKPVEIHLSSYGKTATAMVGKKIVGQATAWNDSRDVFVIMNTEVREQYRKRGIAREMYQAIEDATGKQLSPAVSLSDDGFEFWKRFRPEAVSRDLRHWKDELKDVKAIYRGDSGRITKASGGTATMTFDTPKANGTHTTIRRHDLQAALEAAGSPAINFDNGITQSAARINAKLDEKKVEIVGATPRTHTPEQLAAMRRVGFQVEKPSIRERYQELTKNMGKRLAQGLVDQFAPIKDISKDGYLLSRLAKGASGAFETLLQGGKLRLEDGVYNFDETQKGGVVDKLLIPLQGEHHDFLRWIAANRAEKLTAQGKENLFSADDIEALKTLADGQTQFDYVLQNGEQAGQSTRDRAAIYADSLQTFNDFSKNVMDMAEQSGLINGDARAMWESEFYVPFYRVADEVDGGIRGMGQKGSMVRQEAFKKLKGGKNALNADLLDNTLMNWAHLLDAAAKNRAAKATLEAAQSLGVAVEANEETARQMGKDAKSAPVWFMDGGTKRHFVVDDPMLLTAISSLEYAGMKNPVMNAMGTMKHILTVGVTASPFFKIRNLIRDSVQVIGTSPISGNAVKNVVDGWKLTDPKSDSYFQLLAGGGTIHFGSMLEGSEAKRIQALVESGVDEANILNDDGKVKAFYRKYIEPTVSVYSSMGERSESANRAALYDQLRTKGMGHAEASLMARDLMDFSMQGSFTSVRFLTQVVPFLNARLQGLYKLGKAAQEDPKRMAVVLGAVSVASLGLLAAFGDDDDWKRRTDSDRNNFWWFKIGGQAFRIPKPFELGAIGTLAERGFEFMFDKEMTGKRLRSQVLALLADNLAMNPVPQLVKPIIDIYANKNSFSGAPIESAGMEKLAPEYRFNDRTSMAARGISTALNSVTGAVGVDAPSPVKVDYMLQGYFGWLGAFIVGSADTVLRPATSQPVQARADLWKLATGNMVSDLRDAPSRYVSQMYEQSKELEQAYTTHRMLVKSGKAGEAAEFKVDHQPALSAYPGAESAKKSAAEGNARVHTIERSDMTADEKREAIRRIRVQQESAARRLVAQ